jgi:hypothetical protein
MEFKSYPPNQVSIVLRLGAHPMVSGWGHLPNGTIEITTTEGQAIVKSQEWCNEMCAQWRKGDATMWDSLISQIEGETK